MSHTSVQEGSVPHKVGFGIIQRAALRGLLGINWPVSPVAPSIAVTLLGRLQFVHVITLEVLRSKCVTGKLRWPKNTLASSHIWIAECLGLKALRTLSCISPCRSEAQLLESWVHQNVAPSTYHRQRIHFKHFPLLT